MGTLDSARPEQPGAFCGSSRDLGRCLMDIGLELEPAVPTLVHASDREPLGSCLFTLMTRSSHGQPPTPDYNRPDSDTPNYHEHEHGSAKNGDPFRNTVVTEKVRKLLGDAVSQRDCDSQYYRNGGEHDTPAPYCQVRNTHLAPGGPPARCDLVVAV